MAIQSRSFIANIIMAVFLTLVAGCGGGQNTLAGNTNNSPGGSSGGGGGGGSQSTVAISWSATGSTQVLGGVQVTLTLPTGVSVATDSNGIVASTVITATGLLAAQIPTPQPTNVTYDSTHRVLTFILVSPLNTGFGPGTFANVVCTSTGTMPSVSAFSVSLAPVDPYGNFGSVSGVTGSLQLSS